MIPTLVLLALAPLASQAPGTEAAVLVRYDLGPLVGAGSDRWEEPLAVAAGSGETRSGASWREEPAFGQDLAIDLVRRLLGEELEAKGRRVALQEDQLVVLGPPALQAKVRGVLDALEAALLEAVDLELTLVTAGPDAALPPLDTLLPADARAQELVSAAAGAPGVTASTFRVRAHAGRTARVSAMRRIPFVRDYDVEIAQGAAIFDPIVGYAEEGASILVRAAPASGGIALALAVRSAEPLAPSPFGRELTASSIVTSEDDPVGYVEAPSLFQSLPVLGRSLAFDAFLPEGRALAVEIGARGTAEGGRAFLVVRRTGGGLAGLHEHRVEGTGRTLFLVNSAALAPPALGVTLEGDEPGADLEEHAPPRASAGLGLAQPAFLYDWVAQRFPVWRAAGPWVAAVAEPGWDPAATDELRALLAATGEPPATLDVEVALRAGGGTPVTVRLPLRLGGSAAAQVGVAREELVDWTVEVAQLAATPDPAVVTFLDGLAFVLRSGPARDGTALSLAGRAELLPAAADPIELGGPLGMQVVPTPRALLAVDERVVVPAGGGARRFVLGRTGGPAELALEIGVR